MNFTSESMTILAIFLGMSLLSFFMSLPYIFKKDEEINKEINIKG